MSSFLHNLSIKKKLLWLFYLVILAFTSISVMQLYRTNEKALLQGIDDKLKAAAYGISYIIPAEYHAWITDINSISTKEYLEKQVRLEAYLRQAGGKDKVAILSRGFAGMAAEVKAREVRLKKQVEVEVYRMTYVRSIIPPQYKPLWLPLGEGLVKQEKAAGQNLWNRLGDRKGEQSPDFDSRRNN